jgi:peptidoglycan/LPS O-acetylase OafA/YrhL
VSHRETRDPVARAAVRHRALDPHITDETRGKRLAGLDGLRAIAVVMVILYHVLPGTLPGGFIGVDIFFVVSGFIITYLLIGERARGTVRLGAFWLRRARRLLPALVTLVLVCCAAALAIGGDLLVGLGAQVLGAFTFSSNWIFIAQDQSYFTQASPQLFRNLWSLAVEEQFYLIWPFVALLLIAFRFTWLRSTLAVTIAAASGLLMAALYTPGTDPSRVYYGSDTTPSASRSVRHSPFSWSPDDRSTWLEASQRGRPSNVATQDGWAYWR